MEIDETPEVQGFIFTDTDEIFDLENVNFNKKNYQSFMYHLLYSDESYTYTSTSNEASTSEVPVNNKVVQNFILSK